MKLYLNRQFVDALWEEAQKKEMSREDFDRWVESNVVFYDLIPEE